jgi:hypothetical protein
MVIIFGACELLQGAQPHHSHLGCRVLHFADIASSALDAASPPKEKKKKKKKKHRSTDFTLQGESASVSAQEETSSAPSQASEDLPETASASAAPATPAASSPPDTPLPSQHPKAEESSPNTQLRLDDTEQQQQQEVALDQGTPIGSKPAQRSGTKLSKEERQRIKELNAIRDVLIQLTPSEREHVYAWNWTPELADKKVKIEGKKVVVSSNSLGPLSCCLSAPQIDPLCSLLPLGNLSLRCHLLLGHSVRASFLFCADGSSRCLASSLCLEDAEMYTLVL